ncbi:MAG TPA: alanine--tRNA ligase [Planctomycetota bacterium]|nr:alanine--tRNA ligase [Planctomycetota bacterium]
MKLDEIRSLFLEFFKDKGHKITPSDSLVPSSGDPSLLFTGAGMNQFKNYFLGATVPPAPRACSSQKCLRTGDIERVGRTSAHHTFFEMLGNFSFGDYFKKEAIHFAWEFLTEKLKIPPEKLSVSVYEDDQQAYDIWNQEIKLPETRIYRFGEDNNFWPANAPSDGPNGPCGPCSEIFYDFGEKYGCGLPTCSIACDCNRFVEIWNLVFMEFDRRDKGELVPLKKKNIDTGMGLERIAAVMQGVVSNFETDIFKHLIKHIVDVLKVEYSPASESGTRIKRIADHIRGLVFLAADGVSPSNEGRGYVERRILRRAVRDGINLGVKKPFLYKLVPTVVEIMGQAYPELKDKHAHIARVIKAEEEKFQETVESGIKLLDDIVVKLKSSGSKIFPGDEAFRLYDTCGFPVDLTESILREKGIKLDIVGYEKSLSEQKELSRAGSKIASEIFARTEIDEIRNILKESVYVGDETLAAEVSVEAILVAGKLIQEYPAPDMSGFIKENTQEKIQWDIPNQDIVIITNKTPFYGESGGQVGDTGWFKADGIEIEIKDTQKMEKYILHIGRLKNGAIKSGMKIKAEVNGERRQAIACNHTATHLLHYALRNIIGSTVEQSGSLVRPERLRFDYSMTKAPSDNELQSIEGLVNQRIRSNAGVSVKIMAQEEARKLGAMALFSEKYGDTVRVMIIGDYSKELCGGSHIKQTGEIGYFRIVSDASIGSGLRRIEAVTGQEALKYTYELEKVLSQSAQLLQTTTHQVPHKIKQVAEKLEQAQAQLTQYQKQENKDIAKTLLERATHIPTSGAGVKLVAEILENKSVEDLRVVVDYLKNSGETIITLLAVVTEGKANLILMMTPKLCRDDFNAIGLIKEIAPIIEGSGGGRKDVAQAGGKRPDKLAEALSRFSDLIKEKLKSASIK